MRLGKTALFHFTSQVVVSLAGFAATFLIAVVLGADGLGEYSVAVAIGFFWLVIPANSISMSTNKRMSESDATGEYFAGGVVLNTVVATGLATTVVVAGWLLSTTGFQAEFVRVLTTYTMEIAVLVVSAVAFRTVQAGLKGTKRVARSGFLGAGERVGRTAAQAFVVVLGYGVGGLVLGHAASLFLAVLLGFVLSPLRPALPRWRHLRNLLSYAKYAWLSALRGRVFGWLDTIVLSFFVSASLIGVYEVAWGIASLLSVASGSISQTLFPEVSELSSVEEYERIRHYLNEALAFSGIFAIPGLFGSVLIGERVLRFYRPEFTQGTTVLLVLVAAYIADIYATQLLNVINAIDRPDAAFRVNGLFIGLNLVLNVMLVWLIGWLGAALATAISSVLRGIVGYYALDGIVDGIGLPFRAVGQQIVASLLMCVVLAPVAGYVPSGRPGTLGLVLFGAVVYTISLLSVSPRVRSKATAILRDTTDGWSV